MTQAPPSAHAAAGASAPDAPSGPLRVALLGNPNTGKTTLFNRLSGLRHKTSNFPGTTQEARLGFARGVSSGSTIEIIDLPGIYSLELDQPESALCRRVLAGTLAPAGHVAAAPDTLLIVVDATNLPRNLVLVGEALRRRLPTVVALNMTDLARARGLAIDIADLESRLGCAVIPCNARAGEGAGAILLAITSARIANLTPPGTQEGLETWADEVYAAVASAHPTHAAAAARQDRLTDRLDRLFTHGIAGWLVFLAVMFAVFWSIFSLAKVPMDLIDGAFASLSAWLHRILPDGLLAEFIADGVVSGVSGTVIFLPQICLLFLLISLLEDTGYLARAAFLVNRLMAPFGLSGHAFVPLLSSHACALPGIMACRGIPDRRERLATILSAPFMSCSARIPVYVLLISVLFPARPALQAAAFVGCYALGVLAGLFSALIARRTILRGTSRPMALELPTYKIPSLRTAVLGTVDRAGVFLKKAGTNILAICVILWWMSTFPHVGASPEGVDLRAQAAQLVREGAPEQAADLHDQAAAADARYARANSLIGRLGRAAQPAFEPLGFDWQLTIGVLSSFAAREVFVSTMQIVVTGQEDDSEPVMRAVAGAVRDDGVTPVFTPSTAWALLIYYVLAMQCLPTLAVTAKEAGGVKWAFLQLAWMSGVAYSAAFLLRLALMAGGAA